MEGIEAIFGIIILLIILVVIPGMRIVRQFERGVVFTLGKFSGIKGPGLRVIIPYIQTMQVLHGQHIPGLQSPNPQSFRLQYPIVWQKLPLRTVQPLDGHRSGMREKKNLPRQPEYC